MVQDKLVWKMFLVLHDPFTGKPEVGQDLMKSSLVASELSDLIMSRHLGMEDDHVVVAGTGGLESDEIATFVAHSIDQQPGSHTVRNWIRALGDTVYEMVAGLAVQSGTVRRQPAAWRPTGRRADRFPAVDLLRAAGPRLRLEHKLRTPRELDLETSVLAGVLGSLRLERVIDVQRDRAAVKAAVAAAAAALPIDLRNLLSGVEAAGDASSSFGHGSPIGPMRRRDRG
ncbi:MAG TPA: GPP34 family phosphoprotein [Pseudonocardia sp.]|jgi:hypothetical protein|nr:GPP34 family phosphoprotein [Pseudonocardia sp.]